MNAIRSLLAVISVYFMTTLAGATSFGTNHSDLWWVPAESGWGVQLVQQGNVIFATMFIYDANMNPTWYVAALGFVPSSGGAPSYYTGALYATQGPGFAQQPFDPMQVSRQNVGTMTFTAVDVNHAMLVYTVNGVQITKSITRQTLVFENYTGAFMGLVNQSNLACALPLNDTTTSTPVTVAITHNQSSFLMTTTDPMGKVCTYSGNYYQSGHFGDVFGGFTCSDGSAGTFHTFEMEVSRGGFTLRFSAVSNTCSNITGRIGGLVLYSN